MADSRLAKIAANKIALLLTFDERREAANAFLADHRDMDGYVFYRMINQALLSPRMLCEATAAKSDSRP